MTQTDMLDSDEAKVDPPHFVTYMGLKKKNNRGQQPKWSPRPQPQPSRPSHFDEWIMLCPTIFEP